MRHKVTAYPIELDGAVRTSQIAGLMLMALVQPASAGPPYVSDDPEPTDYKHFEIYSFSSGTATQGGNQRRVRHRFQLTRAAPDLQLTATVPAAFGQPTGGNTSIGLSNVELAAKYRFLHQDTFGLDSQHLSSRVSAEWLQRSGQ